MCALYWDEGSTSDTFTVIEKGAYMPSALLQNGLLEDCLTFPSVYHIVHLRFCWFSAGYNMRSPLHYLPASSGAVLG